MNQKLTDARSLIRPSSCSQTECPTCKGTGIKLEFISTPETVAVYGDDRKLCFGIDCPDCKGGLSERSAAAKSRANIPASFYDASYSAFDWSVYRNTDGTLIDLSKARRLADSFLKQYSEWKSRGIGLYLFSHTKGSGKTFLASCLANDLIKRFGVRAKFVSATQLLDLSQSGDRDSNDIYKRDPIRLLCECELLVLDDLGQKRTGADWLNEVLFKITDERMTNRLVTVFTSNLSIDELTIDDRVIERINRVSIPIKLPEFNVRSKEALSDKLKFLEQLGLSRSV